MFTSVWENWAVMGVSSLRTSAVPPCRCLLWQVIFRMSSSDEGGNAGLCLSAQQLTVKLHCRQEIHLSRVSSKISSTCKQNHGNNYICRPSSHNSGEGGHTKAQKWCNMWTLPGPEPPALLMGSGGGEHAWDAQKPPHNTQLAVVRVCSEKSPQSAVVPSPLAFDISQTWVLCLLGCQEKKVNKFQC